MNIEKIKRLLGLASRSNNLFIGEYSILNLIKKDKVKFVIFSNDISKNSKEKIIYHLNNKNILYETLPMTKLDVGKIVGKKLATCMALTDENFASGVMKYIGGNIIAKKESL